jgi:hypothetical protein
VGILSAAEVVAKQFDDLVEARSVQEIVGHEQGVTRIAALDKSSKLQLWKELNRIHRIEDASHPPMEPVSSRSLNKIELDTGSISFSNGVPVGASAHLSLFPNGAFSFTGHFHNSGAPSYNVEFVWVIRACSGTVFTFAHQGRVHGTFEAGSRNSDWGESGTNPALAQAWGALSSCNNWRWNAAANADLGALLDSAVKALGQTAAVIAIVA